MPYGHRSNGRFLNNDKHYDELSTENFAFTFNKASFIFKKTDDHSVGLPKGEKVLNEYFWGNQEKNDIEKKM